MKTIQKRLRLSEKIVKEIESLAAGSGEDFSRLVRDLLVEALKMRRCPGIIFADGRTGRRARIVGTGIDVWEFIAQFRALGEDYEKLKESYHWLSEQQLRSGLAYYALYPEDINTRISANDALTENVVYQKFPFLRLKGTRK